MAGNISNFLLHELLDHALRNSDYVEPTTVYVALFTALPTDSGGGTEVSGGSYARQSITFGAAASREVVSNATVTFPAATADWGTILGWALFDASSAGNMLWWGECLDVPKVVTSVDTSGNLLTVTSHGYTADQRLQVEVENGTLPSPLADNTTYYARDVVTNQFGLAATLGGAAIDITTVGNGTIWVAKDYKKTVQNGDQYKFTSGQLTCRIRSSLGT